MVASSNDSPCAPTMKSTAFPFGRNHGHRWVASPSLKVVSSTGVLPEASTR